MFARLFLFQCVLTILYRIESPGHEGPRRHGRLRHRRQQRPVLLPAPHPVGTLSLRSFLPVQCGGSLAHLGLHAGFRSGLRTQIRATDSPAENTLAVFGIVPLRAHGLIAATVLVAEWQ